MSKKATLESVEYLQKLFDALGKYGGEITTKNPGNWWDLLFAIRERKEEIVAELCLIQIGEKYMLQDPFFELHLKMDGNKIVSVDIERYYDQTWTGVLMVDGNDKAEVILTNGMSEKLPDEIGLVNRFELFMYNIIEVGPYLSDPETMVSYDDYVESIAMI